MDLSALRFAFFNPDVARQAIEPVLQGMWITVQLGVLITLTGLAAGLVLAFIRALHLRALNIFIIAFADVMRALPPLVVLMVLFFAFPYVGLAMSAFFATWLALSLVLTAFAEEIFWAGIQSIPKGQAEAARSTGMSWFQSMIHVVVPQACKLAVPPLTNRVIAITKATALGAIVGLSEVLNNSQTASSTLGNATPLTLGAIGCLVIFVPVVVGSRLLEHRFRWKN